jgi:hypothetical protein
MKDIPQPATIKVYQLLKMSGMSLSYAGGSSTNSMGLGFYNTLQEAEHNRSLEILKDVTVGAYKPTWHIFELEFPNPVYKE